MPMAVIISSTLPSTDFEDLVPLKSDRIIGFGREDWKLRGQEMGDASELSIVCKSSGRLGIHIQLDGTACSALPSATSGRGQLTAMLQAKLEQAVFFSGKKHNPISFDLAHYDGGDLNTASLNVSKEILNSHAALLSSGRDMTTRLSERYQRIKSIISCIQTADMASRLSIESRFQLCWNAEKLAAASALWNQYQSRLAGKERERAPRTNLKQIFHDAASQCLKKIGNHSSEDPISILMKYHVDALAELIYALQLSVGKLHTLPLGQQAELTRDVNKIIILSLRSAWSYRKQNVASYALQSSSSIEPWTASEQMVKALTDQYKRTLATCRANLEQSAGTMDVDDQIGVDALADITFELKDQLCDLADATLQAHSEHLQYLEGLPQSSVHNIAISAAVDTYDEAKVQLLTPLVELKKTQSAVQLAERYKDFITLVKLSVGHEKKISNYIAKYQQEYANALFMWYHDNDQLPTLLEQGDKYSDLFTVFLDNRSICGEIAWLHDIKIKRFAEASERVQENAFLEANIDRRRTMFSLSKLLFLAGLPRTDIDVESSMKFASRNNEELEMATIQTLVADEWEENHVGSLVSLEDKADAVIKSFGSHILARQPTLREAILQSIRSLLNRQTISSEDLLDVLMLQQTFEIDNFDVSDVALGICLHAADIPESRRLHVLQDIWRRIYIADEDGYWRLEDMSDFEAREKLLGSWMCRAYGVIYRAEGHKDELLLRPEEATCDMPENLFRERFMAGADQADTQRGDEIEKNYRGMIEDYQRENDELQRRIQEGQLQQKWERVKVIIKEIATSTVPESVLLAEEALMEDVEMQESML
ncbi:hypothetical protein BG011_007880 [Mortierella polycephala]|uniref:Nucleoporin Nup133/Nup155-like C-terminal domain-containing protein n=1 Tax=Mortierella polycephala TaxID=41804 RepID=A0A9P6PP51_9FUNG|nr:hypothetical protein BG011_007880 [Mortierella polycephala]